MNAQLEIRDLFRALRLADEPQDWGIVNADSSRIREFLGFCEAETLTSAQQFAMGELILASINEVLDDGADADGQVLADLDRLLALDLHGLRLHIRYWSSLDEGEFPIAALLRRLAIPA